MNVRTPEELNQRIHTELAWRRKELHEFYSLVRSSETRRLQLFIRGAVAVLYAHWEGFIKAAGESYLEFVRIRRLQYKDLTPNFVALALQKLLQEAQTTNSMSAYLAVVGILTGPMTDRALIPRKNVVNTRWNLSSTVFREIVEALGLEYRNEYATAEKPVIDRLLELRNNIAHGGDFERIEFDEYEQLHNRTVELLILFGNDIDNSATLKRYQR